MIQQVGGTYAIPRIFVVAWIRSFELGSFVKFVMRQSAFGKFIGAKPAVPVADNTRRLRCCCLLDLFILTRDT